MNIWETNTNTEPSARCEGCGNVWDGNHSYAYQRWAELHKSCSPKLQLLVIDLGTFCAVKVEKGDLNNALEIKGFRIVQRKDSVHVVPYSFTELREAIERKPVPRIEKVEGEFKGAPTYRFYADDADFPFVALTSAHLDALNQLARGGLKVYEGGKWERLPSTANYIGDPLESVGIAIWRYTR